MVLKGQKDFTLEKLLNIAYDPYLTAFKDMIPALVKAYDEISGNNLTSKSTLAEPVDVLGGWDMKYSLNSVATTLAIYWGQQITATVRPPESASGNSLFDYIATEVAPDLLLDELSKAITKLTDDFGTWKIPWGEINRYQRLTGDIVQQFDDSKPSLPVNFASSRWGSLASFGSRTYPGTKKMYGTSGNSFVAVVEFGERVTAKSILAGGISGDPESSHFDDQAAMYTNGKFKDVLFYMEDLEKFIERKYHPGI